MLQIKHVSKTFNKGTVNEKQALRDLNLTLKEGDFVTIIGGNGAGKSTMLNAIAGVWPVDEGQIIIDDKDVTKLPDKLKINYPLNMPRAKRRAFQIVRLFLSSRRSASRAAMHRSNSSAGWRCTTAPTPARSGHTPS